MRRAVIQLNTVTHLHAFLAVLAIILEAGLLPFIAEKFSDGHLVFHDNDHIMSVIRLKSIMLLNLPIILSGNSF